MTVATGRQVGKSFLGVDLAVTSSLAGPSGEVGYYVAPIHRLARKPWRLTERLVTRAGAGAVNRSEKVVRWAHGFETLFQTAEVPGDVVSESPVFVLTDESGRMADETFDYIAPARRVHDAIEWRLGTPRGKNRFYEDGLRGLDEDGNSPLLSGKPPRDARFVSFRAPSTIAPWWTPEAIDEARRTMPDAMFRQEILAEFLSDAATVFSGFERLCTEEVERPDPDGLYVIGVDLAKHQDFTDIRVFRVDGCPRGVIGREVAFSRLRGVPWMAIRSQVAAIAGRFNNAGVVPDATGVGDPIVEELRTMGVNVVEDFKFTARSKAALVENLIAKVQTDALRLLTREADPVGFQEMTDFECEPVAARGRSVHGDVVMRYGHASGKHDDSVMARALAVWGIGRGAAVTMPVVV